MSPKNADNTFKGKNLREARQRLQRFDDLASGQTRTPVANAGAQSAIARSAGAAARLFITAIDGEDNRKDVADLLLGAEIVQQADSISLQDNIRAVALLTHKSLLMPTSSGWQLTTNQFGDIQELCAGERFFDYPASTPSTAFLVREDLVVTLRHNLDLLFPSLGEIRVVFDFALQTSGNPGSCKTDFSSSEVFEVTDRYSLVDESRHAFVALRLSRPVTDRRPVVCNFGAPIGAREKVFMIGHPCGLPKIYADGAIVLDASSAEGFTASLDAFSGNSGSPVFNAETGQVEGILAEGGDDFRWREDEPGRFCNYTIVHEAPALFDYKVLRIQKLQRLLGP